MTDRHASLAGAVALLLSACTAASPAIAPSSTPEPTASAIAETASPTPSQAANVLTVSARANIFGAGHEQPPAPGGGSPGTDGDGELPPGWPVPQGTASIRFLVVDGELVPIDDVYTPFGAAGDPYGTTDMESWDGISGIVGATGMFLMGVFLTDAEPVDPAPERLDFTNATDFAQLSPLIAQTFFIGDGVGHAYVVPEGATRLFLGFADGNSGGQFYHGLPGYYDNNHGELMVTVLAEE